MVRYVGPFAVKRREIFDHGLSDGSGASKSSSDRGSSVPNIQSAKGNTMLKFILCIDVGE